jgi:hypothetical protein
LFLIGLESVEAMEDTLRAKYDLKRLKIRKLGFARKSFGGTAMHVKANVPKIAPNIETVSDKSDAE